MPTCLPEDYNKYKHLLESEHFLKWCKDIKYPDDESIYGLEEFYWKFCEKEKKKILKDSKERVAQYCFLTLQNFLCKPKDVDKMLMFIKKIEYLYEHGYWIIETGKSDNLHIHMLVKIIDPKRHKRKLNIEWNKIFGNNITDKDFYKLTQWRESKLMPSYEAWVNEKLDYFDNTKKGSHQNCEDLGLNGQFGVGGVLG